ncbi:thiamine pyrophosphate-binding protein [Salinibacterium sp. dk2585]|uniref:thiamine pyrophosphate-binding protein n=1 Tax=unclassified Salinibacterium TaxID=2632331 RepID=UPI0011C251A9|nr:MULTISPECIES: thiamine pyrophosphate-binding protein [unclassified Salinibacterium]QEE60435.1 thiamine pyrophosphate-binding protein [Salinibacterium sp. dk2585]TXK55508.1 thiamine pyrophosphate-binding protein [Salinibacterium sp. dk5596]
MSDRVTVAEAVGRTLAHLGAGHVFGVVGSGNFHVTNAILDGGVEFTAARHEMGAACMADAYARLTGKVAIVSVHQGCGLTNAMTGIVEAAKCHSPVLVVSGDTANGHVTSNFYIDQDAAVRALGAVPERIHSAKSAVSDAARAFRSALYERRTVVLSLPIDIQDELVEWSVDSIPAANAPVRAGASQQSVREVLELLAEAERPVIVAGRGAWGAGADLRELGARIGALLVTSAAGRGLFVDDDWALDIMGGFATDGAAELVQDADVVLAFGVALNNWTTRSGSLLANAKVVQVDDRLDAIGWHRPVDVGVWGDAREVAQALVRELPGSRVGYRSDEVAVKVRESRYWADQAVESRAEERRVDPRELSNALEHILPTERVVVPDGGNFACYPAAHLRVPDERGFCFPASFQSIGLALSSAIGAAVASPERLVVAGIGDGGFMMSLVELDTAVRLGLGMVIVIYNDSAYGAEVHHFEHVTDQLETVVFPETDLAAIARGFGCDAITVETLDDVDAVSLWLAGPRDRPLVIDAKVAKFASWVLAHAHRVEKDA